MPRLFFLLFLACGRTGFLDAAEPILIQEPAIKPAQRQHWAFQAPIRPAIPSVRMPDWVRTPIDAFILAKLEAANLTPAPEANRLTLLRRITIDLTGLPPTPEEQDAFLTDSRPDAYERVVERLLNSPHYGERWAQHWLDVVRYAESNGYEADAERLHAWRYRDYVVRSFNSDKPFRQFIVEQLAGDLLAQADPTVGPEAWIATGLHRCGPMHFVGGNSDLEVNRQEILTEMVNGVSSAFLGLTIGCARCHDHKFDPISAADYYRLQAFFAGTQLHDRDLAGADEKARYARASAALQAKIGPVRAQVAALDGPYQARLTEAKRAAPEPKYRDALAVPETKRTPEQKQLAAQSAVLVKVTWDEIIAALTPSERRQRQAWRDEIHALETRAAAATRRGLGRGRGRADAHYLRAAARRHETQGRRSPARFSADLGWGNERQERQAANPPRPGQLAGSAGPSVDGPRLGESALGTSFWPRFGGFAQRFRLSRRPANASRTARLAGHGIRAQRRLHQDAAALAGAVGHISASGKNRIEDRSAFGRQSLARPYESAATRRRGDSRPRAGGRRQFESATRRASCCACRWNRPSTLSSSPKANRTAFGASRPMSGNIRGGVFTCLPNATSGNRSWKRSTSQTR